MIKIAINGFGRIGRIAFRRIFDSFPNLEIVAINDLTEPKVLAHLLKHDSVYRAYEKSVASTSEGIIAAGKKIKVFSEKDPANLLWKKLGVDIVLECTGKFTDKEGAGKHLQAGAKKVIISAPAKSDDVPTFVLGVNEEKYNSAKDRIVSMASCTTNCLAPVAKILDRDFGIEKGFMTTVHSYTNDQRILDLEHKDLRRARAAGINIIPTTTGATSAVEEVLPQLKGKLNGLSLRVPTPTVSIVDFTAILGKKTTSEEINSSFAKASAEKALKGILGVEKEPLVSSDFIGSPYSSIIDAASTQVIGNLAKVLAWYDNEWGYCSRLAEFAELIAKTL